MTSRYQNPNFSKDEYWRNRRTPKQKTTPAVPEGSYIPQRADCIKGVSKKARRRARMGA